MVCPSPETRSVKVISSSLETKRSLNVQFLLQSLG
jgi:hypothetical protein